MHIFLIILLIFWVTINVGMCSKDKDTSGLLLLTSDGGLTNKVLRPSAEKEKEYLVRTSPPPTDADLEALRNGVMITTVPQRDGNSVSRLLQCRI